MRNLLALLAACVILFIGLGWYLGWYHVQSAPAPDGHRQVNIDLDTKKIAKDVRTGVQKGTQEVQKVLAKDDKKAPAPPAPPVEGKTTGFQRSIRVNDDGSVTYTGDFTVPLLPAQGNQ